jgi:predicted permease
VVDWREQNQVFSHLVAYVIASANLQETEAPLRVRSVEAEAGLFEMLGAEPLVGRTFLPGEDKPDRPPVVILGEALWEERYGRESGILGRTIKVNGQFHTVVGIMPARFRFPAGSASAALWLPLRLPDNQAANRASHFLSVTARLARGVDLRRAQAQMSGIARRLEQQYPEAQGGTGLWVRPLHEEVVGRIEPLLWILFGAVGIVLLIACANVSSMLLARAAVRNHEVAVRSALGAGKGRLVSQFLTESILLSGMGGLVGILLAHWAVDVLIALMGVQIPRTSDISIDGTVMGFSMLLTALAGVGFGLIPALLASDADALGELGRGSCRARHSRQRSRMWNILVVGEFALAFILMTAAGLLVRTWVGLTKVDSGMVTENVLTMRMSLPADRYPSGSAEAFYRDVLGRVEALPGVRTAGFTSLIPLQGYGVNGRFELDGQPWGAAGTEPYAEWRIVSPGYFQALGIPIIKGRDVLKRDDKNGPPVVLINETLARQYYPDRDPIGNKIRTPTAPELFLRPKERWMTIVGIVADVKGAGLHRRPRPEIYFPFQQLQQFDLMASMSLAVKAQVPVAGLTGAIRSAVRAVDPGQPVYNIKKMERVVSDSLSGNRMVSWLFGSFAGVALVLALAGIYGVISYMVVQRTREFGLRLALGACPGNVMREVVGRGILLVAAGLALGMPGALALTRIMSGLLYGVTATDIPTYMAVSILLGAVAMAACALPARRAMRVDPIASLRHE